MLKKCYHKIKTIYEYHANKYHSQIFLKKWLYKLFPNKSVLISTKEPHKETLCFDKIDIEKHKYQCSKDTVETDCMLLPSKVTKI